MAPPYSRFFLSHYNLISVFIGLLRYLFSQTFHLPEKAIQSAEHVEKSWISLTASLYQELQPTWIQCPVGSSIVRTAVYWGSLYVEENIYFLLGYIFALMHFVYVFSVVSINTVIFTLCDICVILGYL